MWLAVVREVKFSLTRIFYSLHTSSVRHRVPPKEHWRSVGSDKADRVQMERRNSSQGSHE